jgi:sucrose-6-phosphate hydrolase SacC (GH32 family)
MLNKFKWQKKGLIWAPNLDNPWAKEYGQNPNALVLEDRIRIYFSSRKKSEDGKYISYIFFVDVDKKNPAKIIDVCDTPILNAAGKGDNGQFDEFGTMPGSFVYRKDKNEVWLYYVGWSRSHDYPYRWANGLAVSHDQGVTFKKIGQGPLISSSHYDYPFLHACPRVFDFNNKWYMWYAGGLEWYEADGTQHPIYVMMHAHSTDGMQWQLSNKQTLPSVVNKECQSGASVIYHNDLYHLFFSYRDVCPNPDGHKQYRIGYASSPDLINWHRNDALAGLDVSPSGWDSEAVCYPHVVQVNDKIYLFYSGNQYGRSGFGYAEMIG